MIPKEGDHVKCVFRNGMVIEGIVEKWIPTVTAVLRSLEDNSTLIITKPTDDIMLTKIFPKLSEAEKVKQKIMAQPPVHRWEDEEKANYSVESLREEFRERLYGPEEKFKEAAKALDPNNEDDIKSLAELKQELIKTERQIVAEKLREHRPAYAPGTTPYHYPSVVSKNNSAYKPGKLPRSVIDGKPGSDKKPRIK